MDTVVQIFQFGITLSIPVLWAAYGELICEQAGVLNVGIEGVMAGGYFGMALGLNYTGNLYSALLIAIGIGFVCGIILSVLYVRLGTDQIVTGILFTVAVLGLTTALAVKYVNASEVKTFKDWHIPGLADIPYLGPILFEHNVLTFAGVLFAPIVFYVMRRTWFGLHARSASEHPKAMESAGLDVWRHRYVALIVGCGLIAVGGAAFENVSGGFVADGGGAQGRGFIAMAVVVLARWNAFTIVAAALLFGVAESFAVQAEGPPPDGIAGLNHIPADFWLMLPYVVTIAAVVFARGSRYPSAVGVPYRPSAKAT